MLNRRDSFFACFIARIVACVLFLICRYTKARDVELRKLKLICAILRRVPLPHEKVGETMFEFLLEISRMYK